MVQDQQSQASGQFVHKNLNKELKLQIDPYKRITCSNFQFVNKDQNKELNLRIYP